MDGWISIHRQIEHNEFYFSERFTKMQAWFDLLLLASHKPNTIFIRGIEVNIESGQLCYSQMTLAKRWKWNRRTVCKFLDLLKKRGMIEFSVGKLTTLTTIINWSKYQNNAQNNTQQNNPPNKPKTNNNGSFFGGDAQQSTQQDAQQSSIRMHTNNNDNNDNNENKYTHRLQKLIFEEYPNIKTMPFQLTSQQAEKLCEKYPYELIIDTLNQMENKDLKKYKRVDLTLNNWLKRNAPQILDNSNGNGLWNNGSKDSFTQRLLRGEL